MNSHRNRLALSGSGWFIYSPVGMRAQPIYRREAAQPLG